jgi:hypothetical protein
MRRPLGSILIATQTDGFISWTILINPNPNRPNLTYEFLGHTKGLALDERADARGLRKWNRCPAESGAVPRMKRYLDEQEGRPIDSVWTDIPPINSQAKERLGYPTQKPLALLDRIIRASSNENDIVLDAFCGCGTALVAAQNLKRQWIGIDISPTACRVMAKRLRDVCGLPENETLWKIAAWLRRARPAQNRKELREISRRLNLRTGRSSPSAAFRTKCRSATWALMAASIRFHPAPRRAQTGRRTRIERTLVSDPGETDGQSWPPDIDSPSRP